jgi:trans-aconitate 2-methyltransferase
MPKWDPTQYDRYADERSRPFVDLIDRVRASDPSYVVDLGCGGGALTATLARRWPSARVHGVDSSPAMLAQAEALDIPESVDFEAGDITDWTPREQVDVLVSNAALQWVPGHEKLLGRFVDYLADGGSLAFQVPGNFGGPSHIALADLVRSPQWHDKLGSDLLRAGSLDPADYLDILARTGCTVDAWETTYLHVLAGADPVLEWTRGTALRPVLDRLDESDAADFTAQYADALRAEYPRTDYGTVFPFRRVFVVARKPGGSAA